MIARALKHRGSISALLSTGNRPKNLSDSEWEKLTSLNRLLEPCKKATEDLGGEKYISCSQVVPTMALLTREMETSEDDPGYVTRFKMAFLKSLSEHTRSLKCDFLKLATALDPRFKSLRSLPAAERQTVWATLQGELHHEYERTLGSNNCSQPPSAKKSRFDIEEDEDDNVDSGAFEANGEAARILSLYKGHAQIPLSEDPLQWWKVHGPAHGKLADLARRYLCSPATTVPCERLFSKAGEIVAAKRASLLPSHVNMMVPLSNWLSGSD